jgi:hypothetical protein
MMLPRLQLFELEDQTWFPGKIRNLATDYLYFIEKTFRLHRPIVPVLADALRATRSRQIIDLCSGGAGLVLPIQRALAAQGIEVRIILTDRFPNRPAFRRVEEASNGAITFVTENVDARDLPNSLPGFRTIFNSFHHFTPADAGKILSSAAKGSQPIAVSIPSESSSSFYS